jgi:hypothetical protein
MPKDPVDRAKVLLSRIAGKSAIVSDIAAEMREKEEGVGDTPILLIAHSPAQLVELSAAANRGGGALYFDGPWPTWFERKLEDYYTLKLAEEGESAVVLGVCISEAGTQGAMDKWLEALERAEPAVGGLQAMIRVTPPPLVGEGGDVEVEGLLDNGDVDAEWELDENDTCPGPGDANTKV